MELFLIPLAYTAITWTLACLLWAGVRSNRSPGLTYLVGLGILAMVVFGYVMLLELAR